jgi:hypothetical protein
MPYFEECKLNFFLESKDVKTPKLPLIFFKDELWYIFYILTLIILWNLILLISTKNKTNE